MRKIGSILKTIAGALVVAILLIPVLGPPLWVEASNTVAQGVVVGKREEITLRHATWTRRLLLDVRYQPADTGAPEQAAIVVDPLRYDTTPVGEAVQVRYLPEPDLRKLGDLAGARLLDQPLLGPLRAQLEGIRELAIGLGAWLILLAAWAKWRRWWLMLPLALGLLGAALYAVSNPPPPAPPGPQEPAVATVRATHLIERISWGRRRSRAQDAVQPYQIVELEFTPRGMAGPVIAIDQVDAGDTVSLRTEDTVPIHYSAANPRWAQIDGASRSYAWRNLQTYGVIAALCAVLLGGAWIARQRRAARRVSQPANP
jgi:hypothetical protein